MVRIIEQMFANFRIFTPSVFTEASNEVTFGLLNIIDHNCTLTDTQHLMNAIRIDDHND